MTVTTRLKCLQTTHHFALLIGGLPTTSLSGHSSQRYAPIYCNHSAPSIPEGGHNRPVSRVVSIRLLV